MHGNHAEDTALDLDRALVLAASERRTYLARLRVWAAQLARAARREAA